MASVAKFSYQRLQNEGGVDEEAEEEKAFRRMRNWSKIRKITSKQRPKIRITGLKRFFRRKKGRFLHALRVSWRKALKRLKDSQAHMNDLFAGNYLFMQINLSPTKCVDRTSMDHNLHGFSPRYSLSKIA